MSDQTGNEPILCYVDLPWAYFTTQSLDEQWGDDWNDAPYEHNAGEPYRWGAHDEKNGKPRWEITRVAFDDICLLAPDYPHHNSPYSVEAINKGKVIPWLRHDDLRWTKHSVMIWAGTSLSEFIRLIHETGGNVYMAVEGSTA